MPAMLCSSGSCYLPWLGLTQERGRSLCTAGLGSVAVQPRGLEIPS